ncbi:MAG: 16S rRNA (guanine(966)-N(2))-methyltransferase RsmD [Chloroflexi bacterium]|nr:16S rRNA (guanine(966)-N(2))-methyltransferase RsmD [Chloroflexota bacterium]
MFLRVTGGDFRGLMLRVPARRTTRPTAQVVREAIFDLLGPLTPQSRVLDLFSGSGALGIEALGRGAELAVFVEHDTVACQAIRVNLETVRAADRGHIVRGELPAALNRLSGAFDYVFADPPYTFAAWEALLERCLHECLVTEHTVVVVEYSSRTTLECGHHFSIVKQRRYGDSSIALVNSGGLEP